ncbi:MAG TPA: flagellar hook protein FlgE [Bryobacteraceae bacterium]|nr:flagellar hook protein FlgE [Bryobacteraceae bacterium]
MAFTAFSTALSSLSAHATAVDVVGNNLANLSTPGFKASTVVFHDLVTQALGLGETQVGLGTGRPLTIRQFSQGALQSSGGNLDAAIQGDGFFIVRDYTGATLLTRAGNFRVDEEGNLLTATGDQVQGWTESGGVVDTNAPIGTIVVPVGSLRAPSATTEFSLNLNLNASAVVGEPSASFSTPIEVVDSIGATHVVTVNFTKTAANTWDYEVTIPGGEVTAGTPGTPYSLGTETLTFDDHGLLATPAAPATIAVPVAGLASGAADLAIDWDLYDPDGTSRLTQYSQTSAVAAVSQDGAPAAQLVKVGLGAGGTIMAQYSNGEQKVVGQIALAAVRNPDSLIAVGNNNYIQTARTASPAIGMPETGGRGKIVSQSLEASTVDIAQEFTNLIVLQRGYQANARVVTAVDEISQETMNMKR